ncbi:anti-FecI sigma factor, FecR [Pseudopedobacter saltans DSM 12145]|uniref:Anti-FecI sigma factor, FecR n=1 Tax=Pseudopedobacter saltans (strain ATCC 51119 / DSM 12145 / JCM 21818 / CCUG 39354 / LMG 10337 / NBRC 100064 / NCIMB 13643) TaxID=762903 RepID=F0S966_PSESL|nr:FecR domain-containing protein [Pseudopedobacter saltans]ADY51364.1 anti-FecI sigma factor, FecR [Pseudopedobacter saltans DSM 12145]
MNNNNKRILELLEKYLTNTCSEPEEQEFLNYVEDPFYKNEIKELLSGVFNNQNELVDLKVSSSERILNAILEEDVEEIGIRKNYSWWKWASVAASVLLGLAFTFYFIQIRDVNKAERLSLSVDSIKVDRDKVYLTLGNGKKINLSDYDSGKITDEEGIRITKNKEGALVYEVSDKFKDQAGLRFNSIEVPRGGKLMIQLPDGTKVWLNAASKFRYPLAFIGKERIVELSGEAYFEVAKNKDVPFKVKTNEQIIEVLGTHFNVHNYADEVSAKTTLLEGSVKVYSGESAALLIPGQQAVTDRNGKDIKINTVNVTDVMAWKNGYYVFENADVKQIMNYLSRWYDVDVEYLGEITTKRFGGVFKQSADLRELLEYLETYGDIHFKIRERRVIVTN